MKTRQLDAIVAAHDINRHPFYLAWRAGTLPRWVLAAYACEYGAFIEAIELGWRRLGDEEHAATERQHAGLWSEFRDALGHPAERPACPEMKALAEVAGRAFGDPVESIGALYAFEAQQPSTARSKLDGLHEHYDFGEEQTRYFRLHADDYGEREALRRLADGLGEDDLSRVFAACERTCKAMWSALDGILRQA